MTQKNKRMILNGGHKDIFTLFSKKVAMLAGHPATFILALSIIIIWALIGPMFGFSDTWQLVVNTGTTIITFLMVFLIQSTQNTDTQAMQLKLDELIRATKGAHTVLLDLEELGDRQLAALRDEYEQIAAEGRQKLAEGKSDAGTPRVKLQIEQDMSKGK